MEDKHRKLIEKYCDKMVDDLDINIIWPKLIGNNYIFKETDTNVSRWEANLDDPEVIKEILLKIRKRGPHAFYKFVSILKKTGYNDLANLLEEKPTNSITPTTLTTTRTSSTTTTNFVSLRDSRNNNNIVENYYNTNRNNNNYTASSFGDNVDNMDNIIDQLENFNINEFHLQTENQPLRVVVEKTTKFYDHPSYGSVYPMHSKPRGLVLIIILKEYIKEPIRNASEHDGQNLKDLFEQMGFKTICKTDLTGYEIRKEVKEFSQNPEFINVDSCFVIISGHGSRHKIVEESYICGIDSHEDNHDIANVHWSEIISYFSHDKCEALRDKPKVFIFQSCRGRKEQMTVKGINNNENSQSIIERNIFQDESHFIFDSDNYRDILVASSTIPDFVSYRDEITGSWYITLVCSVFMKYANTYHIKNLFRMVDNRIALLRKENFHMNFCYPAEQKLSYCQTTAVRSINFNRQLYLNPGLFETE